MSDVTCATDSANPDLTLPVCLPMVRRARLGGGILVGSTAVTQTKAHLTVGDPIRRGVGGMGRGVCGTPGLFPFSSWGMPFIVGVCLGGVSVVMGKLPAGVAEWSGLALLGGAFGYILAALVCAWVNASAWWRAFAAGCGTIVVATVVYYLVIFIFHLTGVGFTESPAYMLQGLVLWSVTGLAVGAGSATAMRWARHGRSRVLRVASLAGTYLVFLGALNSSRIWSLIVGPEGSSVTVSGGDGQLIVTRPTLANDIYQVVLAVTVLTVLLVLALRATRHPLA